MDPVCERCGASGAIEWDTGMWGCQPCGVRFSEIRWCHDGFNPDVALVEIGSEFMLNLAVAWWRAGS